MYRQKRRHDFYDNHFKVTAVKLGALPGVQAQDVAAVLEVHPVMLYRWKKEYREGKFMSESKQGQIDTALRRELKRLQSIEKAHVRLKQEHSLLKKSIQYCSERKRKSSSS